MSKRNVFISANEGKIAQIICQCEQSDTNPSIFLNIWSMFEHMFKLEKSSETFLKLTFYREENQEYNW